MFDIDEALDKIISKYGLDEYYPHFQKAKESEKLLETYIGGHRIRKENILFLCNDQMEVNIVTDIARGDELIEAVLYKKINQDFPWNKYVKIYIMSYEKYSEMSAFLKEKKVGFVWIYDIFKENNYDWDREFYKKHLNNYLENFVVWNDIGWRNLVQMELYNCQQNCKKVKDERIKDEELKKCLYLSLYMRNFKKANYYFSKLEKKDVRIKNANREIKKLLEEIKNRVRQNREKNIVVYWMDAVCYEDSKDMQYLQKKIKESVNFENAFTTTPYTTSTMKSMFLGKYLVDDKAYKINKIDVDDSKILTLLKEQGYNIQYISGLRKMFPYECCTSKRLEIYDACSVVLWDLLNNMINQKNKTFYVAHILSEGHYPFLSSRMTRKSLSFNEMRYIQGLNEIDEQLEFYDQFLNEETYCIYMSDHGGANFSTRFHIIFSVYNKYLESKVIKDMFSIIDFGKTINQIIQMSYINENELKREYVRIQDVDWYNSETIWKRMINKVTPNISMIGYKGVITSKEIYIRFRNDHEWYALRDGVKEEPALWNKKTYLNNEMKRLREFVGEYPIDIIDDEKFKYSKYMYKLVEKYDNYAREYKKRYMKIICKELDKYPTNSVAIRMGGDHSMNLYNLLNEEYKDKISCFIDNNKKCICKKYGKPIVTLDELPKGNIQAIILSSYDHLKTLRKEVKQYTENIDVIDIYVLLEKNGIYCTQNFYMDIKLKDEDYDVGFPFEDFE
ncbi:MAG: sulfatase-like hydrolase/transferase [Lachnospiraceae bacterium]|nr:sulfatase-like hydrolase/transferase [Lachnospiraceae bacterium]